MESPIKKLGEELDCYLGQSRITYLIYIETVKPSCDVVIDGMLSLDAIVKQIISECR